MRRLPATAFARFLGLALVLATVVTLATPATAQTSCPATIALSHAATDTFAVSGTQTVTVTVENEHNLAEVIVTVRTQIAEGWTVDPTENEITLGPGASGSVDFLVTASANPGESAQMNVQAQGQCSANGSPFPVTGAATTNTATDTLVLRTAAQQGLPFPDLGAIPPQYFLGALGLVAVVVGSVFAMRRTTSGFQVTSPEPEKTLRAGRGTSFPIDVKNRRREPDTAHFEVGDVPEGWNAFMALPELTLAGGESRTLWLMVRAPQDATPESSAVIAVTVRSGDDPKATARVVVRAVVKDDPVTDDGFESTTVG